ncbi:MAG TPA: T9SS type A sorting domain-containing protein [Luteibaculaceae bacterium]|nr:T9SS type A sorting domain-containing protein [Luteibaculaceae bacterium]
MTKFYPRLRAITYWKFLFTLAVIILSFQHAAAQCTLVADIEPIPRANICLGETVDLLAKNNLTTPIPAMCAVTTDRTCGTGSDSINTTVGNGNVVNTFNSSAPELFGDFGEAQSRNQIIILASELQAMGFVGGKITALSVDIARIEAGKSGTISSLSIKMLCTSQDKFTTSFISGLDEVFAPKPVTVTAGGFFTFNFDKAFEWDGVSNIVIEFCGFAPNGTGAAGANWGTFTRDHVPGFSSWRQSTSSVSSGTCLNGGTERNFNQRPNIRFNICRPKAVNLSYLWTPNDGSLSATNVIRPTASPITNTRYFVRITNNDVPNCFSIDSIDIAVEDPSLFTPSSNSPVCVGNTLQLNANTVGVSYFWSGPNGFSSTAQNPTIPNVTEAAEGTYTFLVDKGFCKATKTINVQIDPIPNTGVPKDSTVCRSTTNINLFGLLTGEDVGGTWIDNNASGALTGSVFNPSVLNNNNMPATFNFTYRIINACGTFNSTVAVTVIATRSAGIDDDTTICETSGAINLFSVLDGTPNTGGTWTDLNNSGGMTPNGFFTPGNLGGNTYQFQYRVTGTSPCPDALSRVTVNVIDQPFAGSDNNAKVCVGGSINLFNQLQNNPKTGGTWTSIDNAGGALNTNTGMYTATGVTPGLYRFRYIVGATAPCIADTAFIFLTVNGVPTISNVESTCSPNNATYTVTFTITGGDPATYAVNPAGTISAGFPKIYTSGPIGDGVAAQFTVSDGNSCGTNSVSTLKRCACPTQAGSVQTTPALQVCNNGSATAIYNGGYASDGNDTLMYVLHTLPGNTLGTIIAQQSSPTFSFGPGITLGTTYYVSAVAGNRLPNNLVDLSDQCLNVSAGVPIRFGNIGSPNFNFSDNPACPGITLSFTSFVSGSPTYSWTGPNNFTSAVANPVINNLQEAAAGTYTLTVSSDGCNASVSKALTVVSKPVVTIGGDASICEGQGGNLRITVNAPAPVVITYTASPGQTQQVLLAPGVNNIPVNPAVSTTYSLIFANYPNSCGYTLTGTHSISVNPAPIVNYSPIGATAYCFDEPNNAKVGISIPSGVTGNLTYSLNGVVQPVINGVANGTQIPVPLNQPGLTVFAVESVVQTSGTCNLRINSLPINYYNLIEPIVRTTVDRNTVCQKDSISLNFDVVASESIIIRYTVNSDPRTLVTRADTSIKIPITTNTFIFVQDASYSIKTSCDRVINEQHSINSLESPDINVTVTNTACNNTNTGAIRVTVNNTTGTFQYSLDGSAFGANNNFTQLFSGFHTLVVLSSNGCSVTRDVEVIAQSNLNVTSNVISTACGFNNGSVNIGITSGTPPYTILFDGNSVNQGTISNLSAGVYPLLVIDGNSCVVQRQLVVAPSQPISFTLTDNGPVDCTSPEYGLLFVSASGGSGNYFYQALGQPVQTDSILRGLFPQTNVITVTDDRGCSATQTIKLTSIQKFIINPQIRKPLVCWEGRDAEILINTTNSSQPCIYSLNNVDYQSNNLFTNIGPGTFTVYVRETTGCRREQFTSFAVTRPEPIKLTVTGFGEPTCFNSTDGFISMEAAGGSLLAKEFTVNGTDYKLGGEFTELSKGNYTLIARNDDGCNSDTIAFTLEGPEDILLSHSFTFNGNQSKASLTITANGGVPIYLYSIDGVNYFTSNVFSDLDPGVYTTYARDSRNCTAVGSVNISGVGIDEWIKNPHLSIAPNPFTDELNLFSDVTAGETSVNVYNSLGQLVYQRKVAQLGAAAVKLEGLQSLPAGVYLIHVSNELGTLNQKLIKN